MPSLREAVRITDSLDRIADYLNEKGMMSTTEVIVVAADGGDNTAELAEKAAPKFKMYSVIKPGPAIGKGRDVRLGMQAAKGKYVCFTDTDLATPVHHIKPMMAKLESGVDMVIGQRNLSEIHNGALRRLSSMLSNALIQLLVARGISDTQCGFKGFRADARKTLFSIQQVNGWGFDFEVIALARRYGFSIETILIDDWKDPKGNEGLVGESPFAAMIKTLNELFSIKLRLIFGRYPKKSEISS